MKLSKTQVGLSVATVLTIAVNAAANLIPFNGVKTEEISAIFQTYFVPAGYVFAIWGIIYILLMVFAFGLQAVPEKERTYVKELSFFYWTAAIANSLWLVAWHYEFFLTTVALMLTLFFSLSSIYSILKENKPKSVAERTIIHLPFQIYFGWVSVALIANISDVLWWLGWEGFGIHGSIWASIMMIIAALLAGLMLLTMFDYAYAAVIVWAIIGIMVKFNQQVDMLWAGGISIAIILGVFAYKYVKIKKKEKIKAKKPAKEATTKKTEPVKKKASKTKTRSKAKVTKNKKSSKKKSSSKSSK